MTETTEEPPDRLTEEQTAACLEQAESLLMRAHNLLAKIIHMQMQPNEEDAADELIASIRGFVERRWRKQRAASILDAVRADCRRLQADYHRTSVRLGEIERVLASKKISRQTRDNFIAKYPAHDFKECLRDFHLWAVKSKQFDHRKFEQVNHAFIAFAKRWAKAADSNGHVRNGELP